MDYKFVAKYTSEYKIPEESDNFYVKHNNEVYEFKWVHTKQIFNYSLKSEVAYKQKDLTFVVYKKKLEIYKNKKQIRKFKSIDTIRDNNGIFYIDDGKNAFVINEEGVTAFCTRSRQAIYFTPDGKLFYTDGELEIGTELAIPTPPCDCYECVFCLPKAKPFFKGYLMTDKIGEIKIYNNEDDPVLVVDGMKVYNDNCIIKDVISISHRLIDDKLFNIILTTDGVYVIYKNIIVKQRIAGFVEIVPERFVIHNFINERSIYELFVLISIFKPNIFKKMSNIMRINNSERLLCKIINDKTQMEKETFLINFILSIPNIVKCKAYRLLDDKGKLTLLNYIDFDQLDADEMFLMIPYNQEHYQLFVDLCVKENKLYLAGEFYQFMKKNGQEKDLHKYLIKSGILIDIDECPNMCKYQEMEMEEQRRLNDH